MIKIINFFNRKKIKKQEELRLAMQFALTQQPTRDIEKQTHTMKPNEQKTISLPE
ncbi:hypothetical protein PVK63_11655 [Aliivibrio sp. S2TY2]|uniref:hypothetical protein n=1 Tax=Aliivibrio TaxID=511678 RepID=UPI0013EB0360|nr:MULTISPECIES: hypothetical protein [Aliivibrio]MDD9175517.1 hypothetical protein [Aliivibrio sp. S3TY1]MDD9192596.1 hypothetical protein [Aliivibrio sp. S2TY2]MDD9200355.1 hypothetical protein [Aliivibrio sp. S2MY1]